MQKTLLIIAAAATLTAFPGTAGTLTLAWTGGTWNDGGSLSGDFTVNYDDATGEPLSLVTADVITGDALDGFVGQQYLFNVSGMEDTVAFWEFDAAQAFGSPANELVLEGLNGYITFLDWQGTAPTTLWLGSVGGQFSSESNPGRVITRTLNSAGGSVGVTDAGVPEPASSLLLGGGLLTFLVLLRWLKVCAKV